MISICLRLLFDLDRFARLLTIFSLYRFRFCPKDEEEKGFLLIPNLLNKSLILDWLSLNKFPAGNRNIRDSLNSIS